MTDLLTYFHNNQAMTKACLLLAIPIFTVGIISLIFSFFIKEKQAKENVLFIGLFGLLVSVLLVVILLSDYLVTSIL